MAVCRVNKTKDFTVMSNHHLRNKNLSFKAKGLLSQMLSLPDDWDYTIRGLAAISLENKDTIGKIINELISAGYITRQQESDERGRFSKIVYDIYEYPQNVNISVNTPYPKNSDTVTSDTETPDTDSPAPKTWAQINTKEINTNSIKNQSINLPTAEEKNKKTNDMIDMIEEYRKYREIIYDNIEYDLIITEPKMYKDDKKQIDEIVDIMLDCICSKQKIVKIGKNEYPHEIVKSRFLKLNESHIGYIVDSLKENTSRVTNIKEYMKTVIYNAPTTIDSYYSAMVNHDLYGKKS